MKEVVIASAARLPIGRLGGTLLKTNELNMGVAVVKESMKRANNIGPQEVDELVFGHNYRTGLINSNSTRIIALNAGFPYETPQFTLNKHCGAGIKSVTYAYQAIRSETADVIIAGGIDQMSKACHMVPGARWGIKVGHLDMIDQLVIRDGFCGLSMIQSTEKLAELFKISREEQDEYALISENRAENAIKEGMFVDEIATIEVRDRKGTKIFNEDECPRFGTNLEGLSRLRPVEQNGTITAGNASSMADGAAAMVVMSREKASELGIKPLAKILSFAYVGVDPSLFGIAPVPAARKALEKAGLKIEDIDLIELNEAFASQSIYFFREMGLEIGDEKVNVNGGAVAMGHPIAATGNIILTKLLYALKHMNKRLGLATMCIGGGQGIAIIVDAEV